MSLVGRSASFLNRLSRERTAFVGLVVILSFSFLAVFAEQISPNDPFELTRETLRAPSWNHPMGTDDFGRDVASRVIHGSRISLIVGALAAIVSATIGTLVGAVAGYFGGKIDNLLIRITEIFQTIPILFLAIFMAAILGPSVLNVILIVGLLTWPSTTRLVRAEFLHLRELEFVEAARAIGVSRVGIVFREILPNALPVIVINTSLQVATAILVEAALSFVGVSDPNVVSWGRMINDGQDFVRVAWWLSFFPGLAIFLTVLSLNLLGDGLNDVLNPRLSTG